MTERITLIDSIAPSIENIKAIFDALDDDAKKKLCTSIFRANARLVGQLASNGKLAKNEEQWDAAIAMLITQQMENRVVSELQASPPVRSVREIQEEQQREWTKAVATADVVAPKPPKTTVKKSAPAPKVVEFPRTRQELKEKYGIRCAHGERRKISCEIFILGLIGGKCIKKEDCRGGTCTFLHQLGENGGIILAFHGHAYIDDVEYTVWYLKVSNSYVGCPVEELSNDNKFLPTYIKIPDNVEIIER